MNTPALAGDSRNITPNPAGPEVMSHKNTSCSLPHQQLLCRHGEAGSEMYTARSQRVGNSSKSCMEFMRLDRNSPDFNHIHKSSCGAGGRNGSYCVICIVSLLQDEKSSEDGRRGELHNVLNVFSATGLCT